MGRRLMASTFDLLTFYLLLFCAPTLTKKNKRLSSTLTFLLKINVYERARGSKNLYTTDVGPTGYLVSGTPTSGVWNLEGSSRRVFVRLGLSRRLPVDVGKGDGGEVRSPLTLESLSFDKPGVSMKAMKDTLSFTFNYDLVPKCFLR